MNVFRLFAVSVFCALSLCSAARADLQERIYVSGEEIVQSEHGDFFLDFEQGYFPVSGPYFDEGFYVLEASRNLDFYPEEYIIQCPCAGCHRYQTNMLLIKNKYKCSSCGQNIFRCKY